MSNLPELSRSLETHTDALTEAQDAEAEAENAYLKAYSIAFLKAKVDGTAATILPKYAQVQCVEEEMAWKLATAKRQRCWNKRDEVKSRIMALMSHNKTIRDVT